MEPIAVYVVIFEVHNVGLNARLIYYEDRRRHCLLHLRHGVGYVWSFYTSVDLARHMAARSRAHISAHWWDSSFPNPDHSLVHLLMDIFQDQKDLPL